MESFWEICEKHKVNQFYTAPTAIRAIAQHPAKLIEDYDLSALKVLGSVGEPINEEAWSWYNEHIGGNKTPIVDTWWQTETGGILIPLCRGNSTKTNLCYPTAPRNTSRFGQYRRESNYRPRSRGDFNH